MGSDALTGKERYKSVTFRGSRRDADTEMARLVTLAQENRLTGRRVAPGKVTLSQLIAEHLAKAELAPGTMASYRSIATKHVEPTIGRVVIEQVDTRLLERFYEHLSAKELSPSSVRSAHALLRASFRTAVRWGWLKTNPAVDAQVPTIHREEPTLPTADEIGQAVAVAGELNEDFGVFVRLSAATGARRGELCALRWSRVDLDAGVVRIDVNLVVADGGMLLKETKNRTKRKVPVDAGTAEVLRAHRRRVVARSLEAGMPLVDDAWVFSHHPDGSVPWRTEWPTKMWDKVRERVGIDETRLHDLRHYQATTLLAAGVPVPNVSKRIGHRDASTTLNVYAQAVERLDRESADIIGRNLGG